MGITNLGLEICLFSSKLKTMDGKWSVGMSVFEGNKRENMIKLVK